MKLILEFTLNDKVRTDELIDYLDGHLMRGLLGEYVSSFKSLAPADGPRPPLAAFVERMEAKLRKNDHKNETPEGWHDLPIDGLLKLMHLEIEEFKVADDFFAVKRARAELVDVANFAMIVDDRLSTLDQDKPRK